MLVLITGPTGSGKTTLVLRAAERLDWRVITVLTTRPARPGLGDTKRTLSDTCFRSIATHSSGYRRFEYEGHQYSTPMRECYSYGASRTPTGVIDWVHPHPEDISLFGGYVLGIVLLPSEDALRERLCAEARVHRLSAGLAERAQIIANRQTYVAPWHLLMGDEPPEVILRRIVALVDHQD